MTRACIVGWAHSQFGRLAEPDLECLASQVVLPALMHAGIAASDVDGIFMGVMNNGFSQQDFSAALVAMGLPQLRFTAATRVENACASGTAAVQAALNFVDSGRGDLALVVGAEKMTATPLAKTQEVLLGASYFKDEGDGPAGFAGLFGRIATAYFDRYGDQGEALAAIAAKNHLNGVSNPYAQMRKDLGFDFCNTPSDRNPLVAGPLRRTDCSLISDGAAAMVIASQDVAQTLRRAIGFRAHVQVNDFLALAKRDLTCFEGAARAWKAALETAGASLDDLDLVETHDCFTIAELMQYEAMGLTPRGEGARAVLEGQTAMGGRLPVNPSGGLKAKGHPIGATGVSQHVLCAEQLMGEGGDMQVQGATLAGVFNMGGAAVANYVSLLERVK